MRDRTELHLEHLCEMKSSSGLSVFWLALWTGRCPWLLVLLRRGPLPAVFPRRLDKRRGKTHKSIHAYTHWRSLRCICVCEHLFRIRHLAPSGGVGFTDRLFRTVTYLDAGRKPITARRSEAKEKNTPRTSQPTEHFAYYPRTQAHTAWKHMNMSPLIEYSSFLVLGWNLNSLLVKLDPLWRLL